MGARLGACHDTRLQLAGAGYLLWYRRAVRTSLYHSKYAPRVGLSLRDTASCRPLFAISRRADRTARLANTRAVSLFYAL